MTAQAARALAIERIAERELMFKSILRYLWWFRVFIEHYFAVVLFPKDIANIFPDSVNFCFWEFGLN